MPQSDPICYLNGAFLPLSEAVLPVEDLGVLRGYGVFEYLRTYDGHPFELTAHLARLRYSAEQLYLRIPWPDTEIAGWIEAVLGRNQFPESGVRLILTAGRSSDGKLPTGPPTIAILAKPLPAATDAQTTGMRLITLEIAKDFPTVKSLNYATSMMALARAREAGADDALYIGPQGLLLEATTMNFFAFYKGALRTAEQDVVRGVTRKIVLGLAGNCQMQLGPALPYAACPHIEEAFVTSTSREIVPVSHINGTPIGDGLPGARTRLLQQQFRLHVQEWRNTLPVRV